MKSRTIAVITVLALAVIALMPMAIAGDDGRNEGEVPGPPVATSESQPAETGSDQDDGLADQVILDDLIVNGSACVGLDCTNGMSFGFDTLVLKENNTRLLFDDTSTSASFPDNDWRLVANASDNGGQEFFGIEDASAGRMVVKIKAGAPQNSIVVTSHGRVGFGTASPSTELHIVDGDTPTVRLEQDGSSGFTAQTWDVAGNETNYFIRDVTNGSKLPFRIRPGAPTSTIDIAGDGDIGFGTASPDEAMHLRRTDGSAVLLVEEASTTQSQRQVLQLVNNGGAQFSFDNGNNNWRAGSDNAGQFRLDVQDGAGDIEFRLDTTGDLEIAGTLTENSDFTTKWNVVGLDAAGILDTVLGLEVSEWSYIGQDTRHIGPMAQDFAAAFGLGAKNTSIATRDLAGVALLAIQALAAENAALEQRVDDLEQRVAELEALIKGG